MSASFARAPLVDDLLASPIVQEALKSAWTDSLPDDPSNRHEEGGWIYASTSTGDLAVRRALRGGQASIDLSAPPIIEGYVVVAKFHTHPNPSTEGWSPGPSDADRIVDDRDGVPDLIRADNGIHVSGPATRRGGLEGPAGYPA